MCKYVRDRRANTSAAHTHRLLLFYQQPRYLWEKAAEKCSVAQAAPLFTFLLSLSLAHALWQWRKKRKKKDAGCSEKLNHGKDMCCCLIQPRTEEEDHWGRRSFSHSTFWSFPACSQWRWVRFITIMDHLMHVFWWPDFYFYYFSDNIVFWIFFLSPPPPHWSRAQSVRAVEFSFLFYSSTLVFNFV